MDLTVSFKQWKTLEYHTIGTHVFEEWVLVMWRFSSLSLPPVSLAITLPKRMRQMRFVFLTWCLGLWVILYLECVLFYKPYSRNRLWTLTSHLRFQRVSLPGGLLPASAAVSNAASCRKPLGLRASPGQFVLGICIWLFVFLGQSLTPCFPPALDSRFSLAWSKLSLFICNPSSNCESIFLQKKKKEGRRKAWETSASGWGLHTLRNIISGTWDPFPFPVPVMKHQGKFELFSGVHPKPISVCKWNHLLTLLPEALHSAKWERKHFRHTH